MFPAAVVEAAEKAAFTGPTATWSATCCPAWRPGWTRRAAAAGRAGRGRPLPRRAADRTGSRRATWRGWSGRAGTVVLGGRCKDMILRGAENIYPGLYEPALHVPGVELAVLVGVPAGDGDERLVAVVQPQPGADPGRLRRGAAGPAAPDGHGPPGRAVLRRGAAVRPVPQARPGRRGWRRAWPRPRGKGHVVTERPMSTTSRRPQRGAG